MKRLLGFVLGALFLLIPVVTFAAEKIDLDDYETKNLKETLESENMTISDAKYVEADDQITIYLFRGQGCGYCRSFLTFLNSITPEYGKYFKLVSFETWYNQENNDLLAAIGSFLGQPAEGVPYIVIGDQVFPGYAESYNDGIKNAISTLYDTKKEERYDVFAAYNDKLVEDERAEKAAYMKPVIWDFIFLALATIIIVCVSNKNKNEIVNALKKQTKKEINEIVEKTGSRKKK